jgi:DNA-directed RNA polymerase subunit beta'
VLDTIKTLGFKYATEGGITISKNDIVMPAGQAGDPRALRGAGREVEDQYERGLITEEERHEQIVNIWTEATDEVADAMERRSSRSTRST